MSPAARPASCLGQGFKDAEFREHHERVAARLRFVAESAKEGSLRAGLLQRAERHEQFAISDQKAGEASCSESGGGDPPQCYGGG
jgi:hypothetical protein